MNRNPRRIDFIINPNLQHLCRPTLLAPLRYKWVAGDISGCRQNHAQQTLFFRMLFEVNQDIPFTCTPNTNRGSRECTGLKMIRHITIYVDQGARRTGIRNRYRVRSPGPRTSGIRIQDRQHHSWLFDFKVWDLGKKCSFARVLVSLREYLAWAWYPGTV